MVKPAAGFPAATRERFFPQDPDLSMIDRQPTLLRLELDPAELPKLQGLKQVKELSVGRAVSRTQSSSYYDTPDRQLGGSGVTYEVRTRGRGYEQSVRADGVRLEDGTVHREWENPLPSPDPDPMAIADLDLRQLATPLPGTALEPVITIDRQAHHPPPRTCPEAPRRPWRSTRPTSPPPEKSGKGGGASTRFRGREPGPVRRGPGPGRRGAAARRHRRDRTEGLRDPDRQRTVLAQGHPPRPERRGQRRKRALPHPRALPGPPEGQRTLHPGLSDHPEGVHQMRVAMRRMRSALRTFRPVLPPEQYARVGDEVKWLTKSLADTRDLDVLHGRDRRPGRRRLPRRAGLRGDDGTAGRRPRRRPRRGPQGRGQPALYPLPAGDRGLDGAAGVAQPAGQRILGAAVPADHGPGRPA